MGGIREYHLPTHNSGPSGGLLTQARSFRVLLGRSICMLGKRVSPLELGIIMEASKDYFPIQIERVYLSKKLTYE